MIETMVVHVALPLSLCFSHFFNFIIIRRQINEVSPYHQGLLLVKSVFKWGIRAFILYVMLLGPSNTTFYASLFLSNQNQAAAT